MNLERLLESIGLSATEVRPYVEDELQEFLNAEELQPQTQEFHDIIFALKNLAYAHTGEHIEIDLTRCEDKMAHRLKNAGTVSQTTPNFEHQVIKEIPIGVVHIAFGNFKQPWSQFDPFKNGTEAEIAMLTDVEFSGKETYTNHLIVTFDEVDEIEYSLLAASWDTEDGNTVLCRIPDFLYNQAKERMSFEQVSEMLSYQLYAALSNTNLLDDCAVHFHSWESGVATGSPELRSILGEKTQIFSPYLTVSRLQEFMQDRPDRESTLSAHEMNVASRYEEHLVQRCDRTIVESENDKQFYEQISGSNVQKFAYSDFLHKTVEPEPVRGDEISFIAGGRPVDEKGFVELIRQVPAVKSQLDDRGFDFHLDIFCKEYDRATRELKKPDYLYLMQDRIDEHGLGNVVTLRDKVSVKKLRGAIGSSNGLLVPSLYDPYCLMPHYAMMEDRVSFVSDYTGISEYIDSPEYLFDPLDEQSLVTAIDTWLSEPTQFVFNNDSTNYQEMYLS